MIEVKIPKFGKSPGIILPSDALRRLNVGDGEKLFLIEAQDGEYRQTPFDPDLGKKMDKAEDIIGRYRNTLRELGK